MIKIKAYSKDIADTGTPENLVPDDGSITEARKVFIQNPSGNTSPIQVGDEDNQVIVIPVGEKIELPSITNQTGNSQPIRLADIWVSVGTNGDDVAVFALGVK